VQATRPTRPGALTHSEAVSFVTALHRFPVQDITLALMQTALTICRRFRLSYWDSAVLAAAKACGCDRLLSEDLSTERDYDGLRVVNPFA
jgi:predicted nucleic acid-binding protein